MKYFVMAVFLSLHFVASAQDFVLLGWNDLGMHCSNKDFSKIAVLPPYNNVSAQLIWKVPNQLPKVVTAGYTVEYSIPNNTTSLTKTNFWTYAQQLFGLAQPLPPNVGLLGKGLSGTMDTSGNHFEAKGIPVTPYADSNLVTETPYQLIHLVAKENGTNRVVATTDVVIPVSNEIGCVQSGCHASEQAILNAHESVNGFNKQGPVLCASCHASNALGTTGNASAGIFSYRIHRAHSSVAGAAQSITTCYKCHPGPNTQCLRDVMSQNQTRPMICQNCHGTMDSVATSIRNGRQPWLNEPSCGNPVCHGSNFAEQPGHLFRQSTGHGGLFCSACHGSPHAITPSREANDNLQSIRLQGFAGALRTCTVCHATPPSAGGPHGLTLTSVTPVGTEVPDHFALLQNFPNPFNPSTTIAFDLPVRSQVQLVIYDVMGREVRMLAGEEKGSGSFSVVWDGKGNDDRVSASGIYFCRLTARRLDGSEGVSVHTIKLLMMK